jgi:hypothetical protein
LAYNRLSINRNKF